MPFWKCYYHIIWTTKHRQPIITPVLESLIFSVINDKATANGCQLLGINGIADHIHLALIIPPRAAPSTVIGNLKGASSREVNVSTDGHDRFRWQQGYGLLTFGAKNLPLVLEYIANQKEHHRAGTHHPYLETTSDDED